MHGYACGSRSPTCANFEGGSSQRSILDQIRLTFSHFVGLRGRDAIPIYWENAHKDLNQGLDRSGKDFFDDIYPIPQEHLEVLQKLVDRTLGDHEKAFRIVRAVRIENSMLWGRYQKKAGSIAGWRGTCKFEGRGPPITTEVLQDIAGSSTFSKDLDSNVCEAYLWHGTHPHTAFKIARAGFEVNHHSRTGKRFGPGGYFAEDPARADHYAGAGRGLYKDYYAMLLCRVLLGRQLHTDEFHAEDVAQHDRMRHDSTLAEPRGAGFREYVAFCNEQVYPEYAVVYERVEPKGSKHRQRKPIDETSPFFMDSLPEYWFSAMGGCSFFHETCPADLVQPDIQALMDSTWVDIFTHDRKDSNGLRIKKDDPNEGMPTGLHVVKVVRVEDSDMWNEYLRSQSKFREETGICTSIEALRVKTMVSLPEHMLARLASDVGEVYLWHGSSPQTVMSIAEQGFPIKLGTFNHGQFGDGAYFVESSSHADEYSEDDKKGYFEGYYAMLLCRVTLGRVQVSSFADLGGPRVTPSGDFDSIMGEVAASTGSFREFLVPARAQIYPEYAIVYERQYTTARVH